MAALEPEQMYQSCTDIVYGVQRCSGRIVRSKPKPTTIILWHHGCIAELGKYSYKITHMAFLMSLTRCENSLIHVLQDTNDLALGDQNPNPSGTE